MATTKMIDGEDLKKRIQDRVNWASEYKGDLWDGYRFAMKITLDIINTALYVSNEREDFEMTMSAMESELNRVSCDKHIQ